MSQRLFAYANFVMAGACAMAAYTGFRGEHMYLIAFCCAAVGFARIESLTREATK